MGTQWSEKLKLAAQAILPPGRRLETAVEIVTLKQLTKGSGFGRSVQCLPGFVTLIHDAQSPRAESFREALIGKMQSSSMSVRIGLDELRRSEMYVVGSNDFVWEARTVFDALRKAGAPEKQISGLLEAVGLGPKRASSPKSLTPAELKKLSILHSLFAQARLVVYDKPFSGLDAPAVQALAALMAHAAVEHNRVMLVLGEETVPPGWEAHSAVKRVSPERQKAREDLGALNNNEENQRLAELVRTLSGNNGSAVAVGYGRAAIASKEPTEIITRPQMIFDAARGKHQEVVRSELINNPNVPDEVREIQRRRSNSRAGVERPDDPSAGGPRSRSSSKATRSPSGRLTRVTWRKRLTARLRPSTGVRRMFRDLLYFSGPAVRDGAGDPATIGEEELNPTYQKITAFLVMLLVMLVAFGTLAVLIRQALRY